MQRHLWISLLLLAGCPKRGGNSTPPPSVAAVGCPSAAGVYIASFVAPEEGGDGKAYTGWVLPLHDRTVETLDGVPEYATIDPAAAAAAGVPPPPPNLWLMMPGGAPCKPTFGAHYAAAIDAPTKNIAYGIELSGCAAPPDPTDASAIALVSIEAPTGCQVVAPRQAAARLGEIDKDGRWQRPTKDTPIPPAFAAAVPPRTCTAPDCEMLWSVARVEVGGQTVAWAGAVNWIDIPPGAAPETQCEWKTEAFSGFFVPRPDGSLAKVTDGQASPLLLTGVLTDAGGAKVLLAAGPGEYTAYDLAGGAATVGRHLVWLVPHPDALASLDRLGPDCAGPDAAGDAAAPPPPPAP